MIRSVKYLAFGSCLAVLAIIWGCAGSGDSAPVAKATSAGIPKTTAKALTDDLQVTSGAVDAGQPSVAFANFSTAAGKRRYLAVWTDSRNVQSGGGTDIYGKIVTSQDLTNALTQTNPSASGTEFIISIKVPTANTPADGNQSQPKAAWSIKDSRFLVVWTDSRNSGYSQIYGQYVDATGNLLKSDGSATIAADNFQISSHVSTALPSLTVNYISQQEPDLIYNPVTQKFVVAWLDQSTKDTDQNQNNKFGPVHGIGCTNSAQTTTYLYVPLPLVDPNIIRTADVDGAGAVSNVQDYSRLLFTTPLTDSGSGFTATWAGMTNETKPKLTFSSIDGSNYVAWSGIHNSISFSASYSETSVTNNATPPVTTYTCVYSSPTFSVTSADATPRIMVRKNSGFGLFQDFYFGTQATNPALTTDPNTNRLLVAWEEQSGAASKQILAQMIDLANFSNYGSQITVSSGTGDRTSPTASFDNVNQRFLVVWEDARNQSANISNIDIYSQFIDPQGNLSGGNAIVTTGTGNQLAPAVAFGDFAFRYFFVIWKDGRDSSNANLFGQLQQFSSLPQLAINLESPANSGNYSPLTSGAIDFGNVNTGSTQPVKIRISNNGNTQLTISSMTIPDAPFSFVTPTPVTISPGSSYDMTIQFAPTAAGSYGGNSGNNYKTTINSNGGQAIIYFSGSGVGINPLTITTTTLADTTPNLTTYPATLATLTGSGGVSPYTWSMTVSPLEPNLSLNATTGVLQQTGGITSGLHTITFTVQDHDSPQKTATRILTLNVGAIGITSTSLTTWTQNSVGYAFTLTASGLSAPGNASWSVPAAGLPGGLPAGLSLSTSGAITSTPSPSVTGNFSVAVTLTDTGTGATVSKNLPITINPPPSILTTSLVNGVVGRSYSQALTVTGGTSPVTWSIKGGSLPAGLIFDTGTGVISGTPTAPVANQALQFQVTDSTGAIAVTPITGNSSALSITINSVLDISTPTSGNSAPPNALSGQAYSFSFSATGGTAPYTWAAPNMPTGFTLNPFTGVLTATPGFTGPFSFVVTLTDSNGSSVSKSYSMTVYAPVSVGTAALNPWTMGRGGYSQKLVATGGNGAYTWSLASGNTLPPGMSLAAGTGIISGTPTSNGTYIFTVTATDSITPSLTGSMQLAIVVNPSLAVTTSTLGNGVVNTAYSQQLLSSGGTTPVLWTTTSTLPAGLILDNLTGIISGVPTAVGTSAALNFTVTDATGATATISKTITIAAALGITTAATLPQATIGASYSQTVSASGGNAPYTWTLTSGSLPTGLTLASATGIISGTVTAPGTYTFILQVADSTGNKSSQAMQISTLSASTPLTILTTSLPSGKTGTLYTSTTLTASGGIKPYIWSVISGSLPTGLNMASATGIISGTPTAGGSYDFIVQVTDNTTISTTQSLSIVVIDPTVSSGMLQFLNGSGTQISLLPFGNIFKGSYTTSTVTLKNTSNNAISITSAQSSNIAFTPLASVFSIPANGTVDLGVSFVPSSNQAFSGTLTLVDSIGNNYQIALTGTGIPINVVVDAGTGTLNFFNTMSITALPTQGKPSDFSPTRAVMLNMNNVTPLSTVTLSVSFDSLPSSPVFYKIVKGSWVPFTPTTVSGNTITFDIADNGPLDSDSTLGVISDPIVAGVSTSTTTATNTSPPAASSSGGGGGGCFIATAAYGSYLDPHVMALRNFRDDVLLQSKGGAAFVKLYYAYSPPVADFIARHDILRVVMRVALTPLVFAVKYPLVFASLLCMLAWFGVSTFVRRARAGNNSVFTEMAK